MAATTALLAWSYKQLPKRIERKHIITYTAWHTASIEWIATKLTFILDGKTIGTSKCTD